MKKFIFAMIVLSGMSAFAAGGFGEGGCGLGSIVMGPNGNQILAATTNGTSASQLFGITSGTSNCTDRGTVAENRQVPMYIEVNRLVLAKEASRGQGDTVAGLAKLMGCNANTLGKTLQSNYDSIFVQTEMKAAGIQQQINSVISKDHAMACGA